MSPQGTGIVDWKAVKAAADAQRDGVLYVVEREASYGGKDPHHLPERGHRLAEGKTCNNKRVPP